jgi:hypothetical protein
VSTPSSTHSVPRTRTHTPSTVENDCSLRILIGVFVIGALLSLGLITVFCLLLD